MNIQMMAGNYFQVNNILHSLFSSVNVKLNNADVNPNSDYYPYKAYVANLLSYSDTAKSSWMQTFGW